MWPVLIITVFAVISIAVYQILPFLIVLSSRSLKQIRPTAASVQNRRFDRIIACLLHYLPVTRVRQFLQRAGDSRPDAASRYLRTLLLWAALPLCMAILLNRSWYQALLVSVAGMAFLNGRISSKALERQNALERSFYKIYRFIDSQMTAGIKATDVIKGLHESIDDPLIKPTLIRFVARYSLTLDIDQAIAEIRQDHTGKDIETLGTQLRQVLATGTAGRSFQRTEDLLFSRYFSLLQKQTAAIRNRLLLAAILMMVPTLLLFLMPMFHEALTSLTAVFG